MRKRIIAVALLACAGVAHASTIVYDNTSVSADNGLVLQGFTVFDSFSTGAASGPLSAVEVILTDYNPSDGGSVSVALYADSTSCPGLGTTDCPGSLVANLGTILDSSIVSAQTLIDVSLTTNPVLSSGMRYWLALGTAGGAEWANTATDGTTGTGVNGEFWGGGLFPYAGTTDVYADTSSGNTPEMQVVVGSSAAPEPGATWLCAGGLGGLLFALTRMRAR